MIVNVLDLGSSLRSVSEFVKSHNFPDVKVSIDSNSVVFVQDISKLVDDAIKSGKFRRNGHPSVNKSYTIAGSRFLDMVSKLLYTPVDYYRNTKTNKRESRNVVVNGNVITVTFNINVSKVYVLDESMRYLYKPVGGDAGTAIVKLVKETCERCSLTVCNTDVSISKNGSLTRARLTVSRELVYKLENELENTCRKCGVADSIYIRYDSVHLRQGNVGYPVVEVYAFN